MNSLFNYSNKNIIQAQNKTGVSACIRACVFECVHVKPFGVTVTGFLDQSQWCTSFAVTDQNIQDVFECYNSVWWVDSEKGGFTGYWLSACLPLDHGRLFRTNQNTTLSRMGFLFRWRRSRIQGDRSLRFPPHSLIHTAPQIHIVRSYSHFPLRSTLSQADPHCLFRIRSDHEFQNTCLDPVPLIPHCIPLESATSNLCGSAVVRWAQNSKGSGYEPRYLPALKTVT